MRTPLTFEQYLAEKHMFELAGNVLDFHDAMGAPVAEIPVDLFSFDRARKQFRADLLVEELAETLEALHHDDIVEVADGLADLIYVAIGMALEFGIPLHKVWGEVHRSNMDKRNPVTGVVLKNDVGKVMKPAGWTPPNVRAAIYGETW